MAIKLSRKLHFSSCITAYLFLISFLRTEAGRDIEFNARNGAILMETTDASQASPVTFTPTNNGVTR